MRKDACFKNYSNNNTHTISLKWKKQRPIIIAESMAAMDGKFGGQTCKIFYPGNKFTFSVFSWTAVLLPLWMLEVTAYSTNRWSTQHTIGGSFLFWC